MLPLFETSVSVALKAPKIQRIALDILGRVVDLENEIYKVGTSLGTIDNWFSWQD